MSDEFGWEPWGLLCAAIRKRLGRGRAGMEDAVQDAVATLIEARQKGAVIQNEVGFCVCVAQRRLVDRRRRLLREIDGVNLDQLVMFASEPSRWVEKLRASGAALSVEAAELLDCMERGVRGSRRLAECLGRDVKSIRERRWRLQKALRSVFMEFYGTPPPQLSDYVM